MMERLINLSMILVIVLMFGTVWMGLQDAFNQGYDKHMFECDKPTAECNKEWVVRNE